jgi:hypothetical protein
MDPAASGALPEPPRPRRYALHVGEGAGYRLVWRLADEGVTVTDDGLEWTAHGISRSQAFSDIASIRLETGQMPRSGEFATCTVAFRRGITLVVNTLNDWGTPDDDRIDPYRSFVEDFHARLSPEDRRRIRFLAGNPVGRYRFAVFAAVLAGAFFVVLPLGLAIVTGEGKALLITLTGAFFVYPVIRTVRRNEPRSYNPDRLDDDLFP